MATQNGRRIHPTFIDEKSPIDAIHKSVTTQILEKTSLTRKLDDFAIPSHKGHRYPSLLCSSPSRCPQGTVYYFKFATAIAVPAVLENLEAGITASIALGTKQTAQKNAIVRNIARVEIHGCTSVTYVLRQD